MTTGGHFKKKVRERMAQTGERYITARAAMLKEKDNIALGTEVHKRLEESFNDAQPPKRDEYNTRFIAYARFRWRELHTEPPTDDKHLVETVTAADAKLYPGGKMIGFMLWIQAAWRRFDSERGAKRDHVRNPEVHAAFDTWLDAYVRDWIPEART